MANDRGHYGNNVPRVGQDPRTIYVEHKHSSMSGWLLGAVAVGGAILFARHQSRQIEQIYKTSGMPYQTFTGSLRESARALPVKARAAYREITTRARPARDAVPVATSTEQIAPAHSVKSGRG
jgi:hypothetical protein